MKPIANRSSKIVAILAVIGILAFGYRCGRMTVRQTAVMQGFQVIGDSMAPTFDEGDRCLIRPPGGTPRIGDVVAVEWGHRSRIKRIAAKGGDLVDLADGRLMVNGRRLEQIISERRDRGFVAPAWVPVPSRQQDWSRADSNDDWVVYGHRNRHQAGRITAVTDDYPDNASVRRILNPVDRLAIKIERDTSEQSATGVPQFDVAFFDRRHAIVFTVSRNGRARFGEACPLTESESHGRVSLKNALDASHPIAVRMSEADSLRYKLYVYREIEYRDDKPSGNVGYPRRLLNDEVFVVGDNVPVSVDSRRVGPLKTSAVIGHVISPKSRPSL